MWRFSGSGSATGIRLTNDANQVVVAAVDGSLRILEVFIYQNIKWNADINPSLFTILNLNFFTRYDKILLLSCNNVYEIE